MLNYKKDNNYVLNGSKFSEEDTEGKAGMGAKAKWRKQQRQSPKVQGISACDGKGGRNGACAAGAAENQGHGLSCHQPDG